MKLTQNQFEALKIFLQSVITAALLFIQTAFFGCVSADNGASVKIDKDTNISVPIELTIPDLEVIPNE